MLKQLFLLVTFALFSSYNGLSQEVFSNAFVGQAPVDLLELNGELYVATTNPFSIQKLNISDPDLPAVTVSSLDSFVRSMVYFSEDNSLYISDQDNQFSRLDLSTGTPITPIDYISESPARSMLQKEGILYYCLTFGPIKSLDIGSGSTIPQDIFDASIGTPQFLALYDNYLYYAFGPAGGGNGLLARIDLSSSTPVEEVLIDDLGGEITAGYQMDQYFYIGLFGGENPIVRIDLSVDTPNADVLTNLGDDFAKGITDYQGYIYILMEFTDLILRMPDPLLGISEASKQSLTAYPNPTNTNVILSSDQILESTTYTIYSITGQKVKNGVLNSFQEVNLEGLRAGIYIIEVLNARGNQNIRVIKL